MDTIPRRDFISHSALAAAAIPSLGAKLFASEKNTGSTPPAIPSSASQKSTCLHVFSKPLQIFSYESTAELLAEAGYTGIDFSVRPNGHVLPEKVAVDLPKAVEAARKAGLRVEMITTAIVKADAPSTEPILRTAADCGISCYRMGSISYDESVGPWRSLQNLKPQFQTLARLNEKIGIHGAYQNHAGTHLGAPIWDLFEILRDIDPRWLGCQYDIRHAIVEGGTAWPLALKLIQPWIRCTDIKDFKWSHDGKKWTIENVPLGEGMVDFNRYFALVKQLGITGPMSVHFEYPPFERLKASISVDEKRRLFAPLLKKDLLILKSMLAKHRIA